MTKFMMPAWKNGELVSIEVNNSGKYRRPKENRSLAETRIVGVDTESKMYKERLTTVTTQVHTPTQSELVITADYSYAFLAVIEVLFPRYAEKISEHDTKQRKVRARKDGKTCRDGKRKQATPVLCVFYNLEYDLTRLFGTHPQFMRTVTAEMDSVKFDFEGYEIELCQCLLKGGAPSFEMNIRKDDLVLRLLGRDMWGYWKGGLDNTGKSLGLGSKDAFAKENHKQSWEDFLLEDDMTREEFYSYSRRDAQLTRDVYMKTVELLCTIDPIAITRTGVIPVSAPSAAARIAFSMGEWEWELPKEWVYRMGAMAYAGARVFNRRRAYVENITVKDISSAYPHAMTIIPNPCTCKYVLLQEHPFELERWYGQWGVMCVSGENLDAYYPALRIHDVESKRLRYIHGSFEKVWATIPEIVIGVVSGRLRIDTVHAGCHVQGDAQGSPLKQFVNKVYDIKRHSEKDSPMYLMSKLLMNSLYGKLVEVQVSTRWIDERCHFEGVLAIPPLIDKENTEPKVTAKYEQQLSSAYADGVEAIRELSLAWAKEFPHVNKTVPLIEILKEKPGSAGQFYLPMHGAQITGFVSAKLGLAAHCTNALQADTDSVFHEGEQIEGWNDYKTLMRQAGYDCPDEGLGSFETEVENASGYLVKTKMYALRYQVKDKKSGEMVTKYKCANHGMRGVKDKSEAYLLLEKVMQEGKATYSKTTVIKWLTAYKKSIKGMCEVEPGEFVDMMVTINAPINSHQETDENGEFRWRVLE